jgi:hypothetical protein
MPITYEATPNPDALRCTPDRPVPPAGADPAPGTRRSYDRRRPPPPGADPAGERVLAIPGVEGVLIHESGRWLTVRRSPGADWANIKVGLERALASLEADAAPGGAGR